MGRSAVRALRGPGRPAFAAARLLDLISGRPPSASRFRDYVLRVRLRDPPLRQPYPQLLGGPRLAQLSPPKVLVSLHSGPLRALDPMWTHLPGEVTVLLGESHPQPRNARSIRVGDDEAARLAVTRQAARALQDGEFLFMTPDAEGAARVTAGLMGTRLSLASGAFALARMTDSPMVPIAVRWRGSAIETVIGPPIAPGPDAVMAEQMLRWFTEFFAGNQRQLSALLSRSRRYDYLGG